MEKLHVLLLGPPEIRMGEALLRIPRRAARAVLFYLASHGRLIGRDELLTLFWENDPEQVARQRLRDTLGKLRASLPDPSLVQASTSLVGLDFQKVSVDQLEFQSLIDQAGHLPWQIPAHQPLPEHTERLLFSALHLWRSPNFLAGADFPSTPVLDEWLARTSQKLERLHGQVAERLSDHAYTRGDPEQALELAQLALVNDNLNENIHYRIMRLLVEMGRRSEARDFFTYVRDLLRQDLDTTPSPRLVDMYRQIREAGIQAPLAGPAVKWKIRQSLQVPFVGRQSQLEELQRAYHLGGGVCLLGESGQGKTRLLQEFTRSIPTRPRLLLATCRPAERSLPFQPLIDLFRNQILPEEWLGLPALWASQLTLLIPDLAEMRPDLDRPVFEADPEAAPGQIRVVLFEAIRQIFLHLAQRHRLLLCVDDAQWSDEATLATVAYLLERPPYEQGGLLVLSARREEKNQHLEALLASLEQSSRIQVLQMSRLSLEEIRELARFVLSASPSEGLLHRLAADTGGNPLYILETLRLLKAQVETPDGEQTRRLPLAGSIQSLIQARLAKLTPLAYRVIECAAVMGADFDPEFIAHISQLPADRVVEALEELEERHLVEPLSTNAGEIHYRFIHDKIREVLEELVNPLQKRLLHARIAHQLEARLRPLSGNHAAILAQHYEEGGQPEQGYVYWLKAGKHALQLFSAAEAAQAFARAEALIPLAPNLSDAHINDLYDEWTELAYVTEDAETIRRISLNLIQLGEERNSPALIGTGVNGLSDACMVENQFEQGLVYANQAIQYLEQGDILPEQMEAYNHRGVFLYMLNRIEEAIEAFQDALTLGAESQEPKVREARSNAHYQVAIARILNGWPQIALNHAIRSLDESSAIGYYHGRVTAYSAMALARYFLGEFEQSRQDSQLGIELAERFYAVRMLGYLHGYRAMVELVLGNADATLAHAEKAIDLGERYGHGEIVALGNRMVGDIFLGMQAYDRAAEYYQISLKASQNIFFVLDPQFRLGLSMCRTGQIEAGQQYMQSAIHDAQVSGLEIVMVMAQLCQSYVYPLQNQWEQAYQLALQVEQEAHRRRMAVTRLMAIQLLGEAALHRGVVDAARQHFETASRQALALGSPWLEIGAITRLSQIMRLAGESDADLRQRITILLERLEEKTSHPRLQAAFKQYKENHR